jgi:hypothetical protein
MRYKAQSAVTGLHRPPLSSSRAKKKPGRSFFASGSYASSDQVFPVYRSDDSPKVFALLVPEALHWMSLI